MSFYDELRQAADGLPGGKELCAAYARAFPQKSPIQSACDQIGRASILMVEEFLRRASLDPGLHDDALITFVVEHKTVGNMLTVSVRPPGPGDREAIQVRVGAIRAKIKRPHP